MLITKSTIIYYKELTPRTLEAVNDLNNIISKIIGTKLLVVSGWPSEVPENSIFIGFNGTIKAQFPRLSWSFKTPEKAIAVHAYNRVIICGRDIMGPSNTMPNRVGKLIQNVQLEYGTINAIYLFINKFLGVRFFYPGEEGTYYPAKTEAIKLQSKRIYHSPNFLDRSMFQWMRMISNKGWPEEYEWAKRNFCYYISADKDAPHAYQKYWDKYGETNPEIFALLLNRDGSEYGRKPSPLVPKHDIKMCVVQPTLHKLVIQDFKDQLAINPNQRRFSVAVGDAWTLGHCQCKDCLKLGSISDREVWFANTIAKLVKKEFPGKDYFVGTLCYGYSRLPPTIKPATNVLAVHTTNFIQRGNTADGDERDKMKEWFKGWAAKSKYISCRPNLGNPVGAVVGLIDFDLYQLDEDLKFLVANHCSGLWFDSLNGHWVSQMPYYYILSQLAYEPKQKFLTLIDDFYLKCYGEGRYAMQAFYGEITDIRSQMMANIPTKNRFPLIREYYTREVRETLQQYLDMALEKAKGTQYEKRVEFAAKGFLILRYLVGENIDIKELEAQWPKWYMGWNKVSNAPVIKEVEVEIGME